jgi:hypothetical protein
VRFVTAQPAALGVQLVSPASKSPLSTSNVKSVSVIFAAVIDPSTTSSAPTLRFRRAMSTRKVPEPAVAWICSCARCTGFRLNAACSAAVGTRAATRLFV